MVYVDGQGNIVRPRRRIPGLWMVCASVATAAIMVQTVPSLAELKDHRARADGLWLSPTVEWHASLGVASIARCDVVHIGAFGRWIAPADLVPTRLRPRLEAIAADDAQLLLAIVAAVFIAHVLRPRWLFLRHFAASAEALRAGRYWHGAVRDYRISRQPPTRRLLDGLSTQVPRPRGVCARRPHARRL
jgi:hypothetical protein